MEARLPLSLKVCEIDMTTNTCLATPTVSVLRNMAAAESTRWRVTVRATGDIPADEVRNRIVFEFVDDRGVVLGATGFAVRTQ